MASHDDLEEMLAGVLRELVQRQLEIRFNDDYFSPRDNLISLLHRSFAEHPADQSQGDGSDGMGSQGKGSALPLSVGGAALSEPSGVAQVKRGGPGA
ncbi:MAG: hypothetical protein DHS20C21_13760 [Gemmatimonadota bacterium]|nr:MAG: hypothetical protein DHS20C21_13760 [Gemmatimonadota bacterium]